MNLKSGAFMSRVAAHLSGDARTMALSSGNPTLATEVRLFADDPGRIRRLAADTACEAVGWVSEQTVLDRLRAVETRASVRQALTDRERALKAPDPLGQLGLSPTEKTLLVLESPLADVADGLRDLDVIDTKVLCTWAASLTDEDALAVLPDVLEIWSLNAVDLAPHIVRLISSHGRAAKNLIEAVEYDEDVARLVIEEATCEFGPEAAVLVETGVNVFYETHNRFPENVRVSKECTKSWTCTGRNAHLAVWFGSVDPKKAGSVLNSVVSSDDMKRLAAAVRDPRFADELVKAALKSSILGTSRRISIAEELAVLLKVPGISLEAGALLVASGDFADAAALVFQTNHSVEALELAASLLPAEKVLRELVDSSAQELCRPEVRDVLARILYEHSKTLATLLHNARHEFYFRSDVFTRTMRLMADDLGDSQPVWAAFWTLVQTSTEVTLHDLVQAAHALTA